METNKIWTAKWIWDEAGAGRAKDEHETVYFRKTFHWAGPSERLTLEVSADSRYRLFVNGCSVGTGPCKGDHHTHYYDTWEVSGLLQPGDNVIAVVVQHYGAYAPRRMGDAGPISISRSGQGGWLLEGTVGDGEREHLVVWTDESWLCLRDEACRYVCGAMGPQYIGYPEQVDGRLLPHGWQQPTYDDRSWTEAIVISETAYAMTGELSPWALAPRPIPAMMERRRSFDGVVRAGGVAMAEAQRLLRAEPITIAPHRRVEIELETEQLTTGYLRAEWSGGEGSRIGLLGSECYEEPIGPDGQRRKGDRRYREGAVLYGNTDHYLVAGRSDAALPESYEPFWFRTFRYVRLTIETGDAPLRLHSVHYRQTGYPLEVRGSFDCSDAELLPLWRISINTLQNCMHETYEDCPFYEQLQYTMDTMMQAVFTYNLSGDDRLARRAIYDFHSSMLPNGMIQSRYPSVFPQVIPGFSLYWIHMLHDHYRYFGDEELIRFYRPSMEQALNWFDRQLTPQGLVGEPPHGYWSFVDWVEEWIGLWGVPKASEQGPITVYSLMYVGALELAAELNEATGRAEAATEYRVRAVRVREAVRELCWDERRRLFRDGPTVAEYSQHTQIWAVLSRTVEGSAAALLMDRAFAEPGLAQVSFAMSYFLFRALEQAGRYERAYPLWSRWQAQVRLGLTSWLEDPITQRSDCHGWGAVPLYEFPSLLLGIQPLRPGFDEIGVSPHPGPLRWAAGSMPTRHGDVEVRWSTEGGGMRLYVKGPANIPVTVTLPGGEPCRYADTAGGVEVRQTFMVREEYSGG